MMNNTCTGYSEDSGCENGFQSDSSISSNYVECKHQRLCPFVTSQKTNKQECVLHTYNISGNVIKTLSPQTFQYFSNCVREINLSNNEIENLPGEICQLKNLEVLNLSENYLVELPESFKSLNKLKVLNLSTNAFAKVPLCVECGMFRLTHIDFSHNEVNAWIKPPMCLPLLQCLNLSYNQLLSFPSWLFSDQCRSLLELDLSFNFCLHARESFANMLVFKQHRISALKSVQKLNLSNVGANRENVNSLLHDFQGLHHLTLGNEKNEFEKLNNFICELSMKVFYDPLNIVQLDLRNVGLAGLPDDFCKLQNLKVLILSENFIDWLPNNFGQLKYLEEFIISKCQLAYLPESFNQLNNLKKLVADNNKLAELTGPLVSLEWLDLYNNNLEDFPLSMEQLMRLHCCDLEFNHFNLEDLNNESESDSGESLVSVYLELKEKLRATDIRYSDRYSGPKRCDSSFNSSCPRKSYESLSSEDDVDSEISNRSYQAPDFEYNYCEENDDNWDVESINSHDNFDPKDLRRYPKGWASRLKESIPHKQKLTGFVFVPSEAHTLTTYKKRTPEGGVDGQFDDCDETLVTADEQLKQPLLEFLDKLHMFVRNPKGPSTLKRCVNHTKLEECFDIIGIWSRF